MTVPQWAFVILIVAAAVALYAVFIIGRLNRARRALPPPICPRCGADLVEWTEIGNDNGWDIERLWYGCPLYRNGFEKRTGVYIEPYWRTHYAGFRIGRRTSAAGLR